MKQRLSLALMLASVVACAQTTDVPENLASVKEAVTQLDSAVTAMYGWEPADSTYNHSIDTVVSAIMDQYEAEHPDRPKEVRTEHAVQQKAYDEARVTWAEFKRLIDADKYKEALVYEGEKASSRGKNSGDFLVYLKQTTHRYVFFSEVLRPMMQEYREQDYALKELINLLKLEKALEDASIQMQADNTGYIPEVYPHVVRDLGLALAWSGRIDEARDLFYDLIDGVYGLTGSALLANYMASDYAEKLYLIEGDKDGAIANWNRFKEAVVQNKSEYESEEVELCLKRIEAAIVALSEEEYDAKKDRNQFDEQK